jgi:hypothetical protein
MATASKAYRFQSWGQSRHVVENNCYEALTPRILGLRGSGKELNEVPRLRSCLGPRLRRSGDQKFLEVSLALSQGGLVEPHLLEAPANLGVLLGVHAAMFVELDRFVCHDLIALLRGLTRLPGTRRSSVAGEGT